jgi:parallel beta-helix repeat protein
VLLSGVVLCTGCATGQTGSTWGVAGTRAAVFATFISNTGGEVEYWVEYGTSANYGSQTAHDTQTVQKNVSGAAIVPITGLQRSTTYHYRACAQDSEQTGGPSCGEDRQFTTVNIDCDDTITADLRLSGNLDCDHTGGRNGPRVGAAGVDINLAGHRVGATNFALQNSGFDDVTIRNGSLYAFGTALELDGASRNLIRSLSAGLLQSPFAGPSTITGVDIRGGEANVIRRSTVFGSSSGVQATDSAGLLVADSAIGSGSGSRGGGVAVFVDGDLARVLRNTLSAGVIVDGSSNRVVDNDVHAIGNGIELFAGSGNLVADNNVHDVGVLPFMDDAGDGIIVRAAAASSRLRDNVSNSNVDDGIDVRSPTTKLRNNHADDNDDFGIDAVTGVTDLGGNTASGNGNPLQCRNVFCG